MDNNSNNVDDLQEYQDAIDIMYQKERLYKLNKDYLSIQPSIKAKRVQTMIKWFIDTCRVLHLQIDVILLAVYLLIKILSFVKISISNFSLVSVTILYMSAKIKSDWGEPVSNFVDITGIYTDKQIFDMERILLKKLDWNINTLVPTDFITVYCIDDDNVKCSDNVVMTLFLLMLNSDIITDYLPSTIAYAAMVVSRRIKGIMPEWDEYLEKVTKYKYKDIIDCANKLYDLYTIDSNYRYDVNRYIKNLTMR